MCFRLLVIYVIFEGLWGHSNKSSHSYKRYVNEECYSGARIIIINYSTVEEHDSFAALFHN